MDHWVILFRIPTYLLTNNRPEFLSKFFVADAACLDIKHLTTNPYHLKFSRQVERFKRTVIAHLLYYIAEHQTNWGQLVQPLTYAYNAQVHRLTGTTPFSLVPSHQPPAPATETTPVLFLRKEQKCSFLKASEVDFYAS